MESSSTTSSNSNTATTAADTEKKFGSKTTILNNNCFAVAVSKRQWLKNVNKKELCGGMSVLSAHNSRIMYIPTHLAYLDNLKNNILFEDKPSKDAGVTYELDSFLPYVIVIGSKSLNDVYDLIYESVYNVASKTSKINDPLEDEDERQLNKKFSMSELMQLFSESDDIESIDKYEQMIADKINNKGVINKKDVEKKYGFNKEMLAFEQKYKLSENEQYLESSFENEDTLLFLYLTESRLIEHCKTKEPIKFYTGLKIKETDLIPNTLAKKLYPGVPFFKEDKNKRSQDDEEDETIMMMMIMMDMLIIKVMAN